MVRKENLVIIVPGYELAKTTFPRWFVNIGVKALGLDNNPGWSDEFATYVKKHSDYSAEVFDWDRGLTRSALNLASDNLAKLLKQRMNYKNVVLFSKSFGGLVAQQALEKIRERVAVSKLIYVATPHKTAKPILPKKMNIVNVFSKSDKLAKKGNLLINRSKVLKLEKGLNIELPGISHSEFNRNIEITYGGKKMELYDFYLQLITS